jgi:hypothetical protein
MFLLFLRLLPMVAIGELRGLLRTRSGSGS